MVSDDDLRVYEDLRRSLRDARRQYLSHIERSKIRLLASELRDVVGFDEVFMSRRDDGLMVFRLPLVDFSPKSVVGGVVHRGVGRRGKMAYNRYARKYKELMKYWERLRECEKAVDVFERDNPGVVMRYEIERIRENSEILEVAFDGSDDGA